MINFSLRLSLISVGRMKLRGLELDVGWVVVRDDEAIVASNVISRGEWDGLFVSQCVEILDIQQTTCRG